MADVSTAPVDKEFYNPVVTFAFEQITVSTVAKAFTLATYSPGTKGTALLATVIVESNGVRYRKDGTAPTSSVGMPLAAGDVLYVWGSVDIKNIKFIRSGAADATLSVEYSN